MKQKTVKLKKCIRCGALKRMNGKYCSPCSDSVRREQWLSK